MSKYFVYMVLMLSGLLLVFRQALAQITVDTTNSADYLVKEILLGNGVLVGNVKFTGRKHAIALYQDESGQLGLNVGIVLTSGNVFFVPGPNKTSRSGWASSAPGDGELEKITRGKTYDASILEFDFVTQSEYVFFEYVFASEEYLEYVGSKFNDVFAFFVEGPGFEKTNIARLADGKTPITVNTVNNERNKEYFVDNIYINTTDPFLWDVRKRKVVENKNYMQPEVPPKYDTQFDGFTTILVAECKVIPNKVYHIKMAIADVADGILDSGVILKGGSFKSYGDQQVAMDDHFQERFVPKEAVRRKPQLSSARYSIRGIPGEIRCGNIEFEFDKYTIPVHSKTILTKVMSQWYKDPQRKIYVTGHTDSFGSVIYNLALSKNRALAVASALRRMGVPEEKMVIACYGETRPMDNNETPDGRARNRRVELVVGD